MKSTVLSDVLVEDIRIMISGGQLVQLSSPRRPFSLQFLLHFLGLPKFGVVVSEISSEVI